MGVIRIVDAFPGTVTRLFQLQAEAEEVRYSDGMKISERRLALASIDLQAKILIKTVIDRMIPTVTQMDMRSLVAMLRPSEQEAEAGTDQEQQQRDLIAARQILAERFGPAREGGNGLAH